MLSQIAADEVASGAVSTFELLLHEILSALNALSVDLLVLWVHKVLVMDDHLM